MSRNHSSTLFCREWTVQKAGLTPELNEDACRIENLEQEADVSGRLIAVSDGATEAVYSRLWARQLVAAVSSDWPSLSDDELGERLKHVSQSFSPMEPGKEVPWFVRNKYLDQGSQATLLVATVTGAQDTAAYDVRAVSVGDCCLILFKSGGAVISFPMRHSDEFGVNPVLLGNRLAKPARYDHWEGQIAPGDLLLIGTDAVSKWALQCIERNQSELLFDALLELFNQATPDVTQPRAGSLLTASLPSITAATISQDDSEQAQEAARSTTLRGLLRHLWPWSSAAPDDATESADNRQAIAAVTARPPNDDGQSVAAPTAQPATEETAADLPSPFEQFIARYRAPESPLHMRNDDSTLVVCMPVRDLSEVQVIRSLQSALARRQQSSPQLDEVSSD